MIDIPRLHTERLTLRAFAAEDLDPYARMAQDPVAMRYVGGPADRAGTWRLIALALGHWRLRGYGVWAVVENGTGEFVGRAGLFNQEGWPGIEITWATVPDRWGRGYATEAGAAVMRFAFGELGLPTLIALVHPENDASRRVAEKLGMTRGELQDLYGVDHVTYSRDSFAVPDLGSSTTTAVCEDRSAA